MKKRLPLQLFAFFILVTLASCQRNKKQSAPFTGDLFDDSHLHEIRMTFSETAYWDSLVFYKKLKDSLETKHYLKCNLSIDGTELKDVGLRLKGESSYDFTKGKKKSFKLDFNAFVRKQKYKGVSRINLNNNYKDPSLMREKLALDMMVQEGLPATRSAYAKVYLNDEYFGVYLIVEAVNKDFIKRNFESASGNLYFGEPNGTLEKLVNEEDYIRAYRKKNNKKRNDWKDLICLVNTINSNEKDELQAKQLDSIFNVDNCLKTWAINNLLVNIDAYNMLYPHNYFLFNDSTSKKMNWINYDYNYSYAAWNPKFTYDEVVNLSIYYCNEKFPFAKLMLSKNQLLKQRYFTIMKNLVENRWDEKALEALINKYHALLKEAIEEDTMNEFSNEDFEKNLKTCLGDKKDPGAFTPGLLEFARDRKAAVLRQVNAENKIN